MGKNDKKAKEQQRQQERQELMSRPKVDMIFGEDQYYMTADQDSRDNPLYVAGKVYPISPDMVDRWLKRGGQIVDKKGNVEQTIVQPQQQSPSQKEQVQQPVESKEQKSEDVETKPEQQQD